MTQGERRKLRILLWEIVVAAAAIVFVLLVIAAAKGIR